MHGNAPSFLEPLHSIMEFVFAVCLCMSMMRFSYGCFIPSSMCMRFVEGVPLPSIYQKIFSLLAGWACTACACGPCPSLKVLKNAFVGSSAS